ncbi:MAG: hypothetical protein M3461_22190 [Pseudomonadota bacterium]|nr:hypothetical protein [Pseudomonadota bacterium]
MLYRLLTLACSLFCAAAACAAENQSLTASFDQALTAGIDGREWNASFPNAMTVDAVHRAVLVRFPAVADSIRSKLNGGLDIAKAEVVLEYGGYEIVPQGYTVRVGSKQKWAQNQPQWHIVAWPLRQPWVPEPGHGPTFNAYVDGVGYWAKYGAADIKRDRFDVRLGPVELSRVRPQGRIDITALLTGNGLDKDIGKRLRWIEEKGLLLKKLETYDMRYREKTPDAQYEWNVPTGGHGLKFKNARLVVTFKPAAGKHANASLVQLPPPTDISRLIAELEKSGAKGKPTAVMPSPAQFNELAKQLAINPLTTMTPWLFRHVMDVYKIGGDRASPWGKALDAGDYKQYERLIRDILETPPRYQRGWGIHDELLVWYLYRQLLPDYVQDHIKAYWDSWLMPDIPTSELFHPNSKEAAEYWEKTKDWRGRSSFFRDGYLYTMTTQNFHHTAAMGALLGGSIIGSEHAMADGRHGLEQYVLKLWTLRDGTPQEMLDHYYLSVTISGQKVMADFGPTQSDRLMAAIALDRSVDLLASAYHPNLRRIVNPSGRARLAGILVEQAGIYGILHTLSQKGVLNYLDRGYDAKVHDMLIWDYDVSPGRVGMQALPSKWASDWVAQIVDNKRFPFEETATDTMRGNFNPPLWRRAYLGRHYGLASQDIRGGTADLIAQWTHKAEPASTMEDLGTLTLRYAVNDPDMATTVGGVIPYAGGMVTYQHKNRAIVCTKPLSNQSRIMALAGKDGLRSLATVIALWDFRTQQNWELYVDGRQITQIPAKLRAGQVVTIKDGVSYLGIIPLPATDLSRASEIVMGSGGAGKTEPTGAVIKPALIITSYNYQNEKGASPKDLDWAKITTASYGGFVVELGDAAEYGDFSTFSKRMQSNRLTTQWDAAKKLLSVEYRSGQDVMEMGCGTDYEQPDANYPLKPGMQTKAVPYRRINGTWPYLPGIDRDTPNSQQGTTGRLEKNGAVLTTEAGRPAYLRAEPTSGVYTGYNPLPEPADWTLSVPGGVVIRGAGKVGLLRVAIQPKENRLWIDYAVKAGLSPAGMATQLTLTGFRQAPRVEVNGKQLPTPTQRALPNGQTAYIVPLG